jgi:hypothetical protein
VVACARRKGISLSRFEAIEEQHYASEYFNLGAWMHYFSIRFQSIRDTEKRLNDRADCLEMLFKAGIFEPKNKFMTVFDFGDRQFDAMFEQGDSGDLLDVLRRRMTGDASCYIATGFQHHNWSFEPYRQSVLF